MLVEDERHSLNVEDLKALLNSDWMSTRSRTDRDLIRLSALKRSTESGAEKTIVIVDDNAKRGGLDDGHNNAVTIHPLDVVSFLSLPFQVIVENEWYDGAFMLWMARAIGYEKLLTAHRKRRFAFRHAGGKDSLSRSAQVLSGGVWPRSDGRYVEARRLWSGVILDNDAKYPGDDPNLKIRADVEPHVAFVHQLKRRSIESYLPKATMVRWDNSAGFRMKVEALFRLSDDQRKHFHMKNGFRYGRVNQPSIADYKLSADVAAGEKTLFDGIGNVDWDLLREGFGRRLSSVYVEERYRPSHGDRMSVHPDDRIELSGIFSAIFERI